MTLSADDSTTSIRDVQLQMLRETVERNPWIPIAPTEPQLAFLASLDREVLYGGAAGGGKSVALLAAGAQFVEVPGYNALLLRRTFADLSKPDSLIPLSKEWWSNSEATYNEQLHKWVFPSGATVGFGYLDNANDIYQYQSAAYAFIGFDELTQFMQAMYLYLFSRNRKKRTLNVPIRMRSASNPGGIGHFWVRKRFVVSNAPGRLFIPAKLDENPYLDQEEYLRALENLEPIDRQRLRDGNWDVLESGGVFSAAALEAMSRDLRSGRVGMIEKKGAA